MHLKFQTIQFPQFMSLQHKQVQKKLQLNILIIGKFKDLNKEEEKLIKAIEDYFVKLKNKCFSTLTDLSLP